MLSAMEFGVWKYMFSTPQYRATGRRLLKVFPKKPKSSSIMQYNNLFIYNELDAVNRLRNRIAHHEPICFMQDQEKISTVYILNCYHRIIKLFEWMDIDSKSLLYGLDHVNKLTSKIEDIAPSPTHRPKWDFPATLRFARNDIGPRHWRGPIGLYAPFPNSQALMDSSSALISRLSITSSRVKKR